MLELLFALIQTGTPTATGASAPPVTVTAAKPVKGPYDAVVDMPADDSVAGEYVAIWPSPAWNAKKEGRVVLTCLIDTHGIAEQCSVNSEIPRGLGFAAAALQMRPTFKLEPHKGPDGAPMNANMNIAVDFKAPDTDLPSPGSFDGKSRTMYIRGNPMPMREMTMVSNPAWVAAPTVEEWRAAYPAKGGGIEGYAVAHCQVMKNSGVLTGCGVVKEAPDHHDFALAARALALKFRLDPAQSRAIRNADLFVDIPIRLSPPEGVHRIESPRWLIGVDPAATPKVFPPEAAAKGVTSGHGVAVCQVGPEGVMAACAADPAASDSPAFGEAAARLASAMKMSLWSADAAPVIGGEVRIGVRLNLREASGS